MKNNAAKSQGFYGSKAFYAIFSVLVAVVLWLYVTNVENKDVEWPVSDIPVQFVGADTTLAARGLTILEGEDAAVSLRLKGKRATLFKLDNTNVQVSVNVIGITDAGTYSLRYEISYPSGVSSADVTVVTKSTDYIQVVVGRLTTVSVPVRGDFVGSIADGYTGGEFSFSPDMVAVTGEESAVGKISYALVTVAQNDMSESFADNLPFTLMDENDQPVDTAHMTTDVDQVFVRMPVILTKDVPLSVELRAGGGAKAENVNYKIDPPHISVSGDKATLNALSTIQLGIIDLAQVISSTDLTFVISLPDGVDNLSGVAEATVSLELMGLTSRTVEVSNIELANIPTGYKASLVTQNLQVLVRGPEASVDLILPHNITVVADLSELSRATGRYIVPAKVYLSGYSDAGVVGEYKLAVEVER